MPETLTPDTATATATATATPVIAVEPSAALIDQPVSILLSGFAPREPITITATTQDAAGVVYSSAIVVAADSNGAVDLSTDTPVNGSYLRADANGLLWSLATNEEDARTGLDSRFVNTRLEPYTITLRAETQDGRSAETATVRLPIAPTVHREHVPDPELVGNLFLPEGEGPFPVVVVVPGSTGGIPDGLAALYASHGFAAIALAYFQAGEGVPPTLTEIPLEYFERALAYIDTDPRLDAGRIAINGVSRGGELALLLGARYPQFSVVVAWVPSDHLHPAIQGAGATEERAAWTHGGEPLPYLSHRLPTAPRGDLDLREGAYLGAVDHLRRAQHTELHRAAQIPVENTQGAILIVSGRDDTLWPSAIYGDWVVDRLREHGFEYEVTHLSYDQAGHTLGPAHAPATLNRMFWKQPGSDGPPLVLALGGTPEGIAAARNDLWPKVLEFLDRNLRRPASARS
ncbi:acyl-CoA thioesterase/bile acid-CoA:amino acid N-acyltransferase family protein [Agromyces sp. MMS24-JH15]|uniref:acyl-CoA thioesterase/bile acid-CoA:amino acid N-acyltransferase family protein n=1 Tax=Agromyces sp. MMS24-JH15 TaxID=3243765 RepID=UPI0037479B10